MTILKNIKGLSLIVCILSICLYNILTAPSRVDIGPINGQAYKVNSFIKNGIKLELSGETDKYKITCAVNYNFFKEVHHIEKLPQITNMKGFYLLTSEAVGTILQKDSRAIASDSSTSKAMILKNERGQYYCLLSSMH
jgi:hypothetical protein